MAGGTELAEPLSYTSRTAEWNAILEAHGMWASSPMHLKDGVARPHFCAGAWWLQWSPNTRAEGLTSCDFGEPDFSPQA